jgi:S1-C subfamily serine protease
MQLLEAKLHDIHARTQSTVISREPVGDSGSVGLNSAATEPAIPAIEPPFAKVSNVVAGSPAEEAGLRQDDQIRKFGSVTWLNHENLSRIKHTVQRSEGVSHSSGLQELTPSYQRPPYSYSCKGFLTRF